MMTSQESYSCSNFSTKIGKNEKVGKNGVTKRGNKGITNGRKF